MRIGPLRLPSIRNNLVGTVPPSGEHVPRASASGPTRFDLSNPSPRETPGYALEMNWLSWLLLESFPALAGLLFLLNFALLVRWRRTLRARGFLIGLAVSAILLGVQNFVTTPRERALAMLMPIERELPLGHTQALATELDESFSAGGLTRAQLLDAIRAELREFRVVSLRRVDLRIESAAGDEMRVVAAYVAQLAGRDMSGTMRSRWQITLRHAAGGWRIAAIEPLFVDGLESPTWDALLKQR